MSGDPPEWPIHQRLAGAAVRAAFALLGCLPLVGVALAESNLGPSQGLSVFVVVWLGWLIPFGAERRGVPWWSVLWRLAGAGVLLAVVPPLAWISLESMGDPMGPVQGLAGVLSPQSVFQSLTLAIGLMVLVPSLALLFWVRNASEGFVPLMAASTLTFGWPVAAASGMDGVGYFAFLGTALTLAPALHYGERLARKLDPAAPRPRLRAEVRPVFATAGPLLVVALSILASLSRIDFGHWPSESPHPERALIYLERCQEWLAERELPFAASLPELTERLPPRLRGPRTIAEGIHGDYVFRLIRSADGDVWCAAADPLDRREPTHWFIGAEATPQQLRAPAAFGPETAELLDGSGE